MDTLKIEEAFLALYREEQGLLINFLGRHSFPKKVDKERLMLSLKSIEATLFTSSEKEARHNAFASSLATSRKAVCKAKKTGLAFSNLMDQVNHNNW